MAKKKHETPPELDGIFKRGIITEDMYREFWPDWWKRNAKERADLIEFYVGESHDNEPELPLVGSLTKDLGEAKRQAKAIGGYVIRRTKSGRFSKRGKTFQAIRRGRK